MHHQRGNPTHYFAASSLSLFFLSSFYHTKLEELVILYSYMEMLLLAPNSGIYTKAGVLTSITYQSVIGINLKSD